MCPYATTSSWNVGVHRSVFPLMPKRNGGFEVFYRFDLSRAVDAIMGLRIRKAHDMVGTLFLAFRPLTQNAKPLVGWVFVPVLTVPVN